MTSAFADAARITPYPFAVHQVPSSPDSADASRATKKKRQRARPDRNPRQEEEVRFNTGPVRSGSRRGARQVGRSYPDDRNGIPDYPPPSFQEATNTGPLSQSSISVVPPPISSIPEVIQDQSPSDPVPIARRMEIDPVNEVSPLDYISESDDSVLVIINKNEIPVCSTDFPSAKHDNKIDWFKRRKQEVSVASTSTVEKSGDVSRGRKLPPLTIPINPDPSGINGLSSPKRRFLSLSPIKTIFPSKIAVQLDRPQSADPSPPSPKFPLGNKSFFRSATSLPVLRLPGSQKKDPLSRRLFSYKGKERTMEPVVQENLQENWEVVEKTPAGERDSFSSNGSTLKKSPTKTRSRSITPSDESHSAAPTTLTNGHSDTIPPQIRSPRTEPKVQKSPDESDQKTTDTPQTSGSPTPLACTPTSLPPHGRPAEPVISLQDPLTPSTVSQSLPALHAVLPRPNITINPRATEGDVSMRDLETLLPMTPVYQTNHVPSVIDELKEKLPPPLVPVAVWCSPAASRSIPDLLTDSDHTLPLHTPSVCSCGTRHNVKETFNSTASPLGMHMYPTYRTPTPPQFTLSKAPSGGEPTRPHYAGRPLPCPPPIPDVKGTIINPLLTVNTAAGKPNGPPDGGKGEGLLIDLEDTSLDTNPLLSPTTTIRSGSDESRYQSQIYLPLIASPSSSTIFPRDPLSTHLSFSPSSIQSTSTLFLPGPNHLTACPPHRYQQQHNHRFPYPLSYHQDPNGFSNSNLDLPSRFRDGIHESLQSDLHRHHGYPQDSGGGIGHCCSFEHSVMPWATPTSVPVTHGVYQQPHYHHHLTMDNAQRQRHHLAHLSY